MKFAYRLLLISLLGCQATVNPLAPAPTGGNNTGQNSPCAPTPVSRPGVTKVLFVGNSLTYTNDLPAKVCAIGIGNGVLIEKEMVAFPNYALEDHWNDGCLQIMINSGYYDFVVVQQGPSSQPDGAASLLEFGKRIQALCQANDTRLAFYMVWPARVNYYTFPGVISNYTAAADATGAILCPVGQVWKLHQDNTGDFSYYGPDDFHPSSSGSDVAAGIIYKALFP